MNISVNLLNSEMRDSTEFGTVVSIRKRVSIVQVRLHDGRKS